MSLQTTKGWHDDSNGPSCFTCWQNLGVVPGQVLHLVVSISGCAVRIPAEVGKLVHFLAWLPHKTTLSPRPGAQLEAQATTPGKPMRLHHTAYVKQGTEYAAWVVREYMRLGIPFEPRCT